MFLVSLFGSSMVLIVNYSISKYQCNENYWYKLDKCANIPCPLSISTQLYLLPGAIGNSENPGKPLDSRAVTPRTFYHFSRKKNLNYKCDKLKHDRKTVKK